MQECRLTTFLKLSEYSVNNNDKKKLKKWQILLRIITFIQSNFGVFAISTWAMDMFVFYGIACNLAVISCVYHLKPDFHQVIVPSSQNDVCRRLERSYGNGLQKISLNASTSLHSSIFSCFYIRPGFHINVQTVPVGTIVWKQLDRSKIDR